LTHSQLSPPHCLPPFPLLPAARPPLPLILCAHTFRPHLHLHLHLHHHLLPAPLHLLAPRSVMDTFVHDPLVDWARQQSGAGRSSDEGTDNPYAKDALATIEGEGGARVWWCDGVGPWPLKGWMIGCEGVVWGTWLGAGWHAVRRLRYWYCPELELHTTSRPRSLG
jgi:hypothetical protein